MTLAWVVGAGGMLGSALGESLRRTGVRQFLPAGRIDWNDENAAIGQIEAVTRTFAECVRATQSDWQIYWAAGLGAMGSSALELARETRLLEQLLASAGAAMPLTRATGTLLLASSAGAIYAGCAEEFITEATAIAPTTDYARAKLEHEQRIIEWVARHPDAGAVIARLATVYGPRLGVGKRQSLISEMARRVIRNQPINIYVPLDTVRDYIAAEDAADALVGLMRTVAGRPGVCTRIVASGQGTTISEITAIFKKIAHRAPRIVTSGSPLGSLYKRRIQFRPVLMPLASHPPTSLVVGISRVIAAERLWFAQHGG